MRRCSTLLATVLMIASADAMAQQSESNANADDSAIKMALDQRMAQAETGSQQLQMPSSSYGRPSYGDVSLQTGDSDLDQEAIDDAEDTDRVDSTQEAKELDPTPPREAKQEAAPSDVSEEKRTADASEDASAKSEKKRGGDAWRKMSEDILAQPDNAYPYIETHGYFRFRTDSFWRLDLSTNGTSSQLPPIEGMLNADTHTNGAIANFPGSLTTGDGDTISLSEYARDGSKFLSSANIRLRLNPIIHATQDASVHVQLDILDNLIMGSTPYQGDNPYAFFSQSQRSPTAAEFGRDAVRVSAAYGELNTFMGTLRVGRMPNQWGLGMMYNNGGSYSSIREPRMSQRAINLAGNTCLDCDYGDYVDRASFTLDVFKHHVMLAYDYALAGVTQGVSDTFGRPRDLGQFDDSQSFVLSITNRPENAEEVALRNRKLQEQHVPVFDYGAYLMYRRQRIEAQHAGGPLDDPSSYTYIPRGAQMFIPNLWLRLEHQPSTYQRLRLEVEVAGVVGNMNYGANSLSGLADANVDRQIRQVAGALEFDYSGLAWSTGFNAGFASGRQSGNTPGLGANYDVDIANDQKFTAFFFDRDYFVDMIMFREVIGTVTNAIYVNPFFRYDLFSKRQDSLGLRLDVIGAMAANPAMTPSGKSFYGAEGDLTVFYRQARYGADLSAGIFLPGNAFNGVEGRPRYQGVQNYLGDQYGSTYLDGEAVGAKPAIALQGRFFWAF